VKSIFERIIAKELPAEIVFENERILAINDIHPKAPIHILIMPKEHFPNLQSVPKDKLPLISEMIEVAQNLAREKGCAEGYRLTTNNGPMAGQIIFHLHFHLLGGKPFGDIV
jgi:histidine triad (HIT) family protein